MRPVQYFSEDYLKSCRGMRPEQVIRFLDDFRRLHGRGQPPPKSRLISIKVPEPLLEAFRAAADRAGVPYQTQIKRLMSLWLDAPR